MQVYASEFSQCSRVLVLCTIRELLRSALTVFTYFHGGRSLIPSGGNFWLERWLQGLAHCGSQLLSDGKALSQLFHTQPAPTEAVFLWL